MATDEAMFYVASQPGKPGFYAACVDDPAYKKDTSKFVAEHIRKGATVTRVTGSEMRAGLDVWLINRRAEKARQEA